MKSVELILLEKFRANLLASFYIVTPPADEQSPRTFIHHWAINLLASFLASEFNITESQAKEKIAMGPADILLLPSFDYDPQNPENNYNVSDFDALFSFNNYAPIDLSHKVAIIFDAQNISTIASNKLLKLLEAPHKSVSIFFMNPTGKELLPTIESRAIKLRLKQKQEKSKDHTLVSSFKQWAQVQHEQYNPDLINKLTEFETDPNSIGTILQIIKDDTTSAQELFNILLSFQTVHRSSATVKKNLLDEIQWFMKAKTFNQNIQERFIGLLESIFPR